MERRFAFKIDKNLKASLYTICRLCGIDNPDKVPIISSIDLDVINVDAEPLLCEKIHNLIGLTISKDDKMPQTMCTLCLDKINDFYEFREMCVATNAQTRQLLGLKAEKVVKDIVEVKPIIQSAKIVPGKRAKKRKSDDVVAKVEIKEDLEEDVSMQKTDGNTSCSKKQKIQQRQHQETFLKQVEKNLKPKEEIKDEPPEATVVNAAVACNDKKLRQRCNICEQRFNTPLKLNKHKALTHLPLVLRYVCTACDEILHKGTEIKNHQLWHKLSKTPYKCAYCGDIIMSTYAYTRHMRDHIFTFQNCLLVLDRECPQCRATFVTNFLYNTHPCAVRTKKCSGCNKDLRNETEYLRHSAVCRNSYIHYSKHIPAAAVAGEACIRIKNENDVEAFAAEALSRIPVVSLTRMSADLMMIADDDAKPHVSNEKSAKKSNKKGVSKKELKRMDELLKSTIDTLVSIKHEPEMCVETEGVIAELAEAMLETQNESEHGSYASNDFDHHADADDFNEEDNFESSSIAEAGNKESSFTANEVFVKQEPQDCTVALTNNTVHIKKEILDEASSLPSNPTAKMPVLKIKIKKEHGTLNSSLVNDKEDDKRTQSEKKKKKKKRKDARYNKELCSTNHNPPESICNEPATAVTLKSPIPFHIKQECLDDVQPNNHYAVNTQASQPEATVMTSIPMMQLQITSVTSGVTFNDCTEDTAAPCQDSVEMTADEPPDVKPNRLELDRMLKITNVVSGVDLENATEKVTCPQQDPSLDSISEGSVEREAITTKGKHKSAALKQKHKQTLRTGTGKAVKSTGGLTRPVKNHQFSEMPQIVAVSSGVQLPSPPREIEQISQVQSNPNICIIKPEPSNRGYSDEIPVPESMGYEEPVTNIKETEAAAERAYIENIDFCNVTIKQEKDIDICDMQVADQPSTSVGQWNGSKAIKRKFQTSERKTLNENGQNIAKRFEFDPWDEESEDEEETDNETDVEESEEEQREYREIEMPPLLTEMNNQEDIENMKENDIEVKIQNNEISHIEHNNVEADIDLQISPITPAFFVISNVVSQSTDMPERSNDSCVKFQHLSNAVANITDDLETALVISNVDETISSAISEDKEAFLEARPFCESHITPTAVTKAGSYVAADITNNMEIASVISSVDATISGTISEDQEAFLEARPFCVLQNTPTGVTTETNYEEVAVPNIANLEISSVSSIVDVTIRGRILEDHEAFLEARPFCDPQNTPTSVITEASYEAAAVPNNLEIASISSIVDGTISGTISEDNEAFLEAIPFSEPQNTPTSVITEASYEAAAVPNSLEIASVSSIVDGTISGAISDEEKAILEAIPFCRSQITPAGVKTEPNFMTADITNNSEITSVSSNVDDTIIGSVSSNLHNTYSCGMSKDKKALMEARLFCESQITQTAVTTETNFVAADITNDLKIASENSNLDETISGAISEDKEALLEARPFCESQITPTAVTTEASYDIEEQQNLLNQEMALSTLSAQDVTDEDVTNTCLANVDTIATTAISVLNSNEETDNLLNENADAAVHRQQQPEEQQQMLPTATTSSRSSSSSRSDLGISQLLLVESNINEIAENNNNANIERELQDDSAAIEWRRRQINDTDTQQ